MSYEVAGRDRRGRSLPDTDAESPFENKASRYIFRNEEYQRICTPRKFHCGRTVCRAEGRDPALESYSRQKLSTDLRFTLHK